MSETPIEPSRPSRRDDDAPTRDAGEPTPRRAPSARRPRREAAAPRRRRARSRSARAPRQAARARADAADEAPARRRPSRARRRAAKPAAASRSPQEARRAARAREAAGREAAPRSRAARRRARAPSLPRLRRGRGAAPKPAGAPPVVYATARYVRSSARKARLVCDHIRGKSVPEARAILAFAPRGVAKDWSKLLESAVANAEHNHELIGDDLRIKEVYADDGPTLKRFRPRAQGRATPILKRTCHLSIALTPKE